MKKIEPNKLPDNYINIIGNEWMLVTAGTKEKFNTMTASWGGTGFLWNRARRIHFYPTGTLYL